MKQIEIALLALIASNPGLRAEQIADRLDRGVADVDALLRPHLAVGSVFEEEVTAPNNRPAMAYHLSEQFKMTDAYSAIVAGRDPDAAQVAQPPSTDAGSKEAGGPPAEADTADTAKAGTRVDRAIACVTKHGCVTNGQMRVATGLHVGQYPVSFLAVPLRDGRLARDGENWVLGPALAPKQQAEPIADEKAKMEIPVFTETANSPAHPVAPAAPAVQGARAGFRCAVWSDGILELQRDGATIASLLPGERAELAGHLLHAPH
jgi:hypothetical protein